MIRRAISIATLFAAAAWAQAPAVTGIAHAAFRVSDIQKAQDFYQKLGYEQFFSLAKDGKTYEWFLKVNDRQFIELYTVGEKAEAPGLMHLCYESDNLNLVHRDVVMRGAIPTQARKGGAGNLLFSLRDPEGQVIEYVQYLPGSRHSEARGKFLGERRISTTLAAATVLVKDVAVARAYYVHNLGFRDLGGTETAPRVTMPGGHEVTLMQQTADAKPGLVFLVDDVQKAAKELESRGVKTAVKDGAVTVTDPDGVTLTFAAATVQQKYFSDWPSNMSPEEIGKRVAERFVNGSYYFTSYRHLRIVYQEVCAWYGALKFAKALGDRDLTARLVKRFDPLLGQEASFVSQERHVDFTVFAALPLEIYMQTQDARTRDLGLTFADRQWSDPTPEGYTSETRWWIDDMFMITAAQVQAYRATNDPKYLDRAALEMTAYLEKLQQPNGLFYHAPDVPFFWSRGDGWVASGMTEMLLSLPADHPRRPAILAGYRKMMKALLDNQGQDGMWRQLIDHPESWPEASSTAMFTFAMVSGVKNGWLDAATYGPAARKAWISLVGYIDQNADVTSVCEGTGKVNSYEHYMRRARRTGDLHGQAPVMWTATALLK